MDFATSLAKSPLSSRQRLSSSPVICRREYAFTKNGLQWQKSLSALISPFPFGLFDDNAILALAMRLRRLIYALLIGLSQMGRRPRIFLIISPFPSRKRVRFYRS
jgi:hypothetical protein